MYEQQAGRLTGPAIPTPERLRQIPGAMNSLASEVQNVGALAEQVEQRLASVLQATGPIAGGGRGDTARQVAAPLVENIHGLRDSLVITCERLRNILDRLEV